VLSGRKGRGTLVAAIVISLLALQVVILVGGNVSAAVGWYNSNWKYRKPVSLGNTGSALTDYQLQVNLTAGNFDFSKARTAGQDIRFTDSDGTTLLPYFIESYAASSATIWVKVPAIPKSPPNKTIYLYYGNPSASSTSSGNNVFQLYDNFPLTGQPNHLDKVSRVGTALTPGAIGQWDELVRERMSVLYDSSDSTYKAWYCGHPWNNNPDPDEEASSIGYATSPDGITWTKYAGNPVLDSGVGPPQYQNPSVVKVGNTFYMYIERTNGYPNITAWRYSSPNGINWVPAPGEVKTEAATPLVWVEGATWYMLYEHYGAAAPYNIHLATSPDGITWTDDGSNPVLSADTASGDVCPDGIYKDNGGTYHLYYHGNSLPRNEYATSINLTTWTKHGTFYPRHYESFVPLKVGNEMWFYAWNTSAYLRLENDYDDGIPPDPPPYGHGYTDGRNNSGYHRFKGYDAYASLDGTRWEPEFKGATGSEMNFNPDGIELSPKEALNVTGPPWYNASVSLKSKKTFINNIIVEVRRKLIGNSYADISLGAGGVIDENGTTSDWWHTALAMGYTWMFNECNHSSSCIRRMPQAASFIDLSAKFNPGVNIQDNFELHKLTYTSSGGLEWRVNGVLKASATDATYLTNNKRLLISQGQYDVDQPTEKNYRGGQLVIDWVRVRKYASTVPTYALGTEQRISPTITSIVPSSGVVGTIVTIKGSNFGASRGTSYVKFNTTNATTTDYVSWSNTEIKIRVPSGATTGPVTVATVGGTSNSKTFTVACPIWYLAEGTSDWGFDTYVTIQNPNATAVTAMVTYMTKAGPRTRAEIALPPESQTVINPRNDIGSTDFSTKVECKEGKTICVDRRMTWTGPGAASPEGHSSVGVTAPAKTWYLPEGSSKWGFECWLLIQNPSATAANCTVTYMIEGEDPRVVNHAVPASTRASFNMETDIGQKDASIKVTSDHPVIPERAMYRNSRREGHDSIGTITPATTCYLAEGTTDWGFTTYVLVQNPNATTTDVTVTYMTPVGAKPQAPFSMSANSRKTIRVNDIAEVSKTDLSTKVQGTLPIIAERAMYWDFGTGEACHDSVGMASPHTTFYLPDGETSEGHETWTLVQNPNDTPVSVEVRYMTPAGTGNVVFIDTIGANSRKTYNMSDKGINDRAAIKVTSKTTGKKIMVERAMYWNARGAGTDTIGGFSD